MKKCFTGLLCWVIVTSCSTVKQASLQAITGLRLIDVYELPHKPVFNNTIAGGFSGIDRNPQTGEYYIISDDRSSFNPARFYTAAIQISERGIDTVIIKSVHFLQQNNGSLYPPLTTSSTQTVDPEAIRYHPRKKQIVWSSEGERIVNGSRTTLIHPSITKTSLKGQFIDTFSLPANMTMKPTPNGPRQNGVFEGVTFGDDYATLWVAVEEPIYEDGPRAGLYDSTAWTRIIKYNTKTRQPIAQYAYPLDAIAFPPNPADEFKVNGVPEILWIAPNKLLVLERSYSVGRVSSTIKIYLADLSKAADVSAVGSLQQNATAQPITKKLLLNMNDLNLPVYNVEGITFGPSLPGGRMSLLLVSDDNFSAKEKTQLFLFEVLD